MNASNKHIVVIDDDKTFVFITYTLIKKITDSRKIELKMSGHTAMQYLDECDKASTFPDIITLDLSMPLGDGTDFLEQYKNKFQKRYPNTKIIVISALPVQESSKKIEAYDFITGVLTKPTDEKELARLLK
ncbi:MAG: response regulator [Microscillaceae bacterium]|nr:response regulator [Microscillaceae bacterium]MDW8460878.1 response regulator [Cytophagales bacterium]